MELIQNILEYYDELYPVKEVQKKFYLNLVSKYESPVKLLRVDCGTGYLEHYLAREGCDVTGIETNRDILKSANLRRRNQLMAVRFFEMSSLDMTRFLGKNFYDVISCLESRIIYMHDRTLIRKFFHDCKVLLKEKGKLILELYNFKVFNQEPMCKMPTRESLRARLFTELITNVDGTKYIQQNVETGNGKLLPVMEKEMIYPLNNAEIVDFAKEAGFKNIQFYADYEMHEFTGNEQSYLVVIE